MQEWLNASLKSTETLDEFSNKCSPKVMSRCLSVPDTISLRHCLKNKYLRVIVSVVRIQYLVLFTVDEGVANTYI